MKKFLAMIKYLFFPFLMAQASDIDFRAITGNETITAMVETENAFWLGTANGLWKVNKVNHKVVHLTRENSVLPANHITDLCATPDGNVYAATANGIFRFDGYAYLLVNSENSKLPSDNITAISSDAHDNLWVGTPNGLVMMNGYKCRLFTEKNSVLSNNNVNSISTDNSGNIYIMLANRDMVKVSAGEMKLMAEPQMIKDAVAGKN